jgi:hypothetical protein
MPEDTAAPLFVSLAIALIFGSLLFRALGLAAVGVAATLLFAAYWLWPGEQRTPA